MPQPSSYTDRRKITVAGAGDERIVITVSELDLMAQLAGLQLVERWANWEQETFTGEHPRHISIYGHDNN